MISMASRDRAWIEEKRAAGGGDPRHIEKLINALILLEQLEIKGLNLIFKGGTSLVLLLDKPKRLSIDIDIIVPDVDIDLEGIFTEIVNDKIFSRYEINVRPAGANVPKAHYKFFYHSTWFNKEDFILLDILFEKTPYIETIKKPINSIFLKTEGKNVEVELPSINCILGDKLTAFAPNTIGIPYNKSGKERHLEIIKQLYDVSTLFDSFDNIEFMKNSYVQIATNELGYRDLGYGYDKALDDTFDTSMAIINKKTSDNQYIKLIDGIDKFRSFVFSNTFNGEIAITYAAKAAYISLLVKTNANIVERFESLEQVEELEISNKAYKIYNRIKKYNPEAFFYLYNALKLLPDEISNDKLATSFVGTNKNISI